jgi:hypothetical protein
VIFTGSALTPCSANVIGAGDLNQPLTVVYSSNTDAGTAGASASFAGDANHLPSTGSASFTIAKASSTTAITCPATIVYTGSALTPCTVSVTGAGGLNLAPPAAYVNNLMVGMATATYTYAGDANHTGSSASRNFQILTAFRIIAFDSPVDMTIDGSSIPKWNLVQNGRTVPLKFRVVKLDGTEVTSVAGLSAWAAPAACEDGWVDPSVLPTELTSNTGLMRTGDRFHFNWAVPRVSGKCYQVFIRTVDGSTTLVGSMTGTPVLEAFFKSK